MKKTLLEVVHDSAKGLYEAGVMDKVTLGRFVVQQDIEAGLLDAKAGTDEPGARLLPKGD